MEPPSFELGLAASLLVSMYFGLVLASLRAASRAELLAFARDGAEFSFGGRLFEAWLQDRAFVTAALHVGQLFSNLGVAGFGTLTAVALLPNLSPAKAAPIGLALATFGILLFGQLLPRALVARGAAFGLILSRVGTPVYAILLPLRRALDRLTDASARLVGGDPSRIDRRVSPDDLEGILKQAENNPAIDEQQRELLESVLEFRDTRVRDVMVPRTDTCFVDVDASLDEVLDLVAEQGYSRYPVYRDTVDQVVGMFFVKDILPYLRGPTRAPFRVQEYIRPAYFVPESKRVSELLREFQLRKIHLAIVVDEFGGTAGIIALEDIIEVIFGDIYDEYDEEADEPGFEVVGDGAYVVDARMSVRDLEDELDIALPESETYDTLAGFIVTLASEVPSAGYELHWERWAFRVLEADNTRVRQVEIRTLANDIAEENSDAAPPENAAAESAAAGSAAAGSAAAGSAAAEPSHAASRLASRSSDAPFATDAARSATTTLDKAATGR